MSLSGRLLRLVRAFALYSYKCFQLSSSCIYAPLFCLCPSSFCCGYVLAVRWFACPLFAHSLFMSGSHINSRLSKINPIFLPKAQQISITLFPQELPFFYILYTCLYFLKHEGGWFLEFINRECLFSGSHLIDLRPKTSH